MGCYGIGISRIVAAAIEQNFDASGILWPDAMAPWRVAVCVINSKRDDTVAAAAEALYRELSDAGCDPARMGIGPVPAVQRLFARTGLGWDDIDLIELNEAFAPQVLAVLKAWGWSADDSRHERLNVNGSGISLGHPIGVSGARILARSEVRRVGKEWVSRFRSRWSLVHSKKNEC